MGRHKVAWALIGGFLVVTAIATIAGSRAVPRELSDPRPSMHLWGPGGVSGLAETLERFGIPVTAWDRPLSRLPIERADRGAWLGLVSVGGELTDPDIARVLDWLERGGGVMVGGSSPIASCLGYQVKFERSLVAMEDERLPPSRMAWEPIPVEDDSLAEPRASLRRCEGNEWRAEPASAHLNGDGAPVILLLRLPRGGEILLLADAGLVTNETLRNTEAGEVVIPLLVEQGLVSLVMDEYHHGFGARASLFGATWGWLRRAPLGWAMLHLAFAGLVSLAALAVRFGPALSVIERHRRSPLEHVDALATGLERANASETAIHLVTGGLRRRLGRAGSREPSREAQQEWIDALALSARSEEARAAVRRLAQTLDRGGGQERVLAAAIAVEDVWQALRPEQSSRTR